MIISSKGNQIVKDLVLLQEKSRVRREKGLFIAEGLRMFREAPGEWLRDVYVTERFCEAHRDLLQEKARDCRITVLSDAVFSHVSDTKTPQGVLCVLAMPKYAKEELLGGPRKGERDPAAPDEISAGERLPLGAAGKPDGPAAGERSSLDRRAPLVLLLEGIQDPGNLGTLFRSAEGAGATGILMDASCADLFGPKTVRATMGSIFRVPFSVSTDFPSDIAWLSRRGVCVYAAYLSGSVCYDEPDYTKGTAILIGNEGAGLKEETAALAGCRIKIPMEGQLESLNAAVSGSILLYEANRQRRNKGDCLCRIPG